MRKTIDSIDILQLKSGNEDAFKKVYAAYHNAVYAVVYRFLKDRERSKDAVQECFINFWLHRDRLDPQEDIWLYLFTIAKRISLNTIRSMGCVQALEETLITKLTEAKNIIEENFFTQELELITHSFIEQLPQRQKTVLKMSRMEGMSHKEIADHLQISTNTVKNHIGEALKTLKSKLHYAEYMLVFAFIHFF